MGLRGDEQYGTDVGRQRSLQRLVSSSHLRRLQSDVERSRFQPAVWLRLGGHCSQERVRFGPSQPVPTDHRRLYSTGAVVRQQGRYRMDRDTLRYCVLQPHRGVTYVQA